MVRGTFSPARAWRPAVVARLPQTLGVANSPHDRFPALRRDIRHQTVGRAGCIAESATITKLTTNESEEKMADLELLRRFATTKMPVRLNTAEEFAGAKELASMGYLKLSIPPVNKGRGAYGQQDSALVLAISPLGKRAINE